MCFAAKLSSRFDQVQHTRKLPRRPGPYGTVESEVVNRGNFQGYQNGWSPNCHHRRTNVHIEQSRRPHRRRMAFMAWRMATRRGQRIADHLRAIVDQHPVNPRRGIRRTGLGCYRKRTHYDRRNLGRSFRFLDLHDRNRMVPCSILICPDVREPQSTHLPVSLVCLCDGNGTMGCHGTERSAKWRSGGDSTHFVSRVRRVSPHSRLCLSGPSPGVRHGNMVPSHSDGSGVPAVDFDRGRGGTAPEAVGFLNHLLQETMSAGTKT